MNPKMPAGEKKAQVRNCDPRAGAHWHGRKLETLEERNGNALLPS